MWLLPTLAVVAGAAIALQAAMNARLGVLLKNSIMATGIAFMFACLFTLLYMLISTREYPLLSDIKAVPAYLWFGGILSAFGVGSFYYLIPKMGVGTMMSFALTGQLVLAVIASHFGWFEQPVKSINGQAVMGLLAMIIGIVLLNGGTQHGS